MIRRAVWIGFALLCVISASSWALPGESGLSALERQGMLFGFSGLAALCFCGRRSAVGQELRLAVAGLGFFGLPFLVVEVARGSVGETSRSALFAIVPVVVVLVVSAGDGGARRLLAPALAGLGGLLLLLPLEFSTSIRGELMLVLIGATVVGVGVCSVWLWRTLRGVELGRAVAVIGIANAAFLLICGAVRGELVGTWSTLSSAASYSSLVNLGEIFLIVWLLREMAPARFAARYLLIPLVTILESYVLMRPEGTVRMVFGTVLLAAGTGLLLLIKEEDGDAVLSLR